MVHIPTIKAVPRYDPINYVFIGFVVIFLIPLSPILALLYGVGKLATKLGFDLD